MPERHSLTHPHASKLHPQVMSYLLAPDRPKLPQTSLVDPYVMPDPEWIFDAGLLNRRLGSIHVEGLVARDISKIAGATLNRMNILAFGEGIEGMTRDILSFQNAGSDPFRAWTARYQIPGELWALTSSHGLVPDTNGQPVRARALAFMPFERTVPLIVKEYERRNLFSNEQATTAMLREDVDPGFNSIPQKQLVEFQVEDVRLLPPSIAKYTRALQHAAHKGWDARKPFSIEKFRNQYFGLDPANPDLTEVFRRIKQTYLGNTTWGTIMIAESAVRTTDYVLGIIPGLGSVRDFLQASTGKEFPLPGAERAIRHLLFEANLPLPHNFFDKPTTSRYLELISAVVGLLPFASTPLGFLPAWAGELTIDALMQKVLAIDKMKNTRKYFGPFLEVANETGTTPKVFDKARELKQFRTSLITVVTNKLTSPFRRYKDQSKD